MRRLLFCLLLVFSFSTVSAANYNYTVDCITDLSENVVSVDSQINSSTTYKITRKTFKNIDENSNTTFCIGKLISKEKSITPISTTTSYIGYYADVDGDGAVDGVIFADLAFSKSGTWNTYNTSDSTYNTYGAYSYSAKSNLKDYYISQSSYSGKFDTKPVISPVRGTTGNDRFYIMALDNFTTSSYSYWYWYKSGDISDYATITSGNFGTGKQNTANMITAWNASKYGSQNAQDIWGAIQTKANDGWFVPSRGELNAFLTSFDIKSDYSSSGTYIANSGNYSSKYGLPHNFWSSSLNKSRYAYYASLVNGNIDKHIFDNAVASFSGLGNFYYGVRLAKTF